MATRAEAETELSAGISARIDAGIATKDQAADWAKSVAALHAEAVQQVKSDPKRHNALIDIAWALRRADRRKGN